MDKLLNILKLQAVTLDRTLGQPRMGLVASVDPASYAARVLLQPEAVLTGWLPILSSWVGNGWGMTCLPSINDQVLVIPQEGVADHGIIVGVCFSNVSRPPTCIPGELNLVHATGSSITLRNDGTIRINGNVHVNGDVFDQHGSLSALRGHYNSHIHPGAAVSPPSPQD